MKDLYRGMLLTRDTKANNIISTVGTTNEIKWLGNKNWELKIDSILISLKAVFHVNPSFCEHSSRTNDTDTMEWKRA